MGTTQPIKDTTELKRFKNYYASICPNERNLLLVTTGLNTALRIGDILTLRYEDIYNYSKHRLRTHITVHEHKTGKTNRIYMNDELRSALIDLADFESHSPSDWLFCSMKQSELPLSRYQAFRIIRDAAVGADLSVRVSPHSLRKTFGYHAWKQGANPVLLMNIYNHSSYQVTKRYLCIDQDEKDDIFRKTCL